MKKPCPAPTVVLPDAIRRKAWRLWKTNGWVEEDDASLCWHESAPRDDVPAMTDLFFGVPVRLSDYRRLEADGRLPRGLVPEPVAATLPAKRRLRRRGDGVDLIKSMSVSREVGRGSLEPDGSWRVVEWDGVGIKSQQILASRRQAEQWLRSLRGVTRIIAVNGNR